MSIKWLVFFLMTWSILVIIGMGVEQSFVKMAAGGDYVTVLDVLMGARTVTEQSGAGAIVSWLPGGREFAALVKALTFRFDFMTQDYIGWLAYLVIFVPIAVSMTIATLFAVRGSPSS